MIWVLAACGPAPLTPPEAPIETFATARFVAFGDAGTGKSTMRTLAETAARVCAERGCDFVLYLGDVRYPDGFESEDDPAFQTVFVEPFEPLDLPFFVVLGNHDYGGFRGAGNHWNKAETAVAMQARSAKWRFPAPAYAFDAGGVRFVGLDTNRLLYGHTEDQAAWAARMIAGAPGPVVAFGHHPYKSAGRHGDAGSYDGLTKVSRLPGARIAAGTYFADFVGAHLCGHTALYVAAHDHDREWMAPSCGMELVVSGAGGDPSPLARPEHPGLLFGSADPGFFYAMVDRATITGTFYDLAGNASFDRTVAIGTPQ